MSTLFLDLHPDLAAWLGTVAAKRGLTLQQAASRLLDEERMRDLSVTRMTVPADNGGGWIAQMPTRALPYTGYEVEWTLESEQAEQL